MERAISGYQIYEDIYESNNALVYRGGVDAGEASVILKMLKQAYPTPEKIAWFKREYELIKTLRLPGVINAYGLEMDHHRPVMVLEDFGAESLERLMKRQSFTLDEFLKLAVEVVDTLGQVHQQHIIHKDINPSNIVLNRTTGQVKLIDFGIASVLTRENPTLRNPSMLEGTLPYISPEQTGRMNRAIDYRTDFYSLGVTFYELLTGRLPFDTTDAMALVHAHIAKQPTPPHEHNAALPQPLSDIVMKLMAKNAEDRYQSAYGLKADLQNCLRQWQAEGRIDLFPLDRQVVSDQFHIPQKLYGREQEIDTLLAAFERISEGDCEMMLVSGYSGVGKSALVQEIYKPITRRRGYFIAGKFDQYQRNIPYAALIQAFRSLMRQLLTESEDRVGVWRDRLLAALGPNAGLIIDVVPEVELVTGPQPPVPVMPVAESQNRFNLAFQNFVRIFTRPEHPLVLFLDDLQWADVASLGLLELLMTAPDSHHLFVLGAYRDNEVNEAHPLMVTLDEIRQAERVVNHIALTPLSLPHIHQLINDTLNSSSERTKPLADLVLAKTHGNPFFMNEFLKSLYTEELLTFDPQHGGWQWDIADIQARGMTDNVVELMAGKVKKLEPKTQEALKLAACIGNQFALQTVAAVQEQAPRETAVDLWEAIVEGLIVPLDDAYQLMDLDVQGLADDVRVDYRFAHDRIQQAVYSLIPAEDKQAVHEHVGHLLLHNTPPDEREQKIFDIVNQLNQGLAHVKSQAERDERAALNLIAGRRAKAAAAYKPALEYLRHGVDLLGQDPWNQHYDLTLPLYVEAADAAFLSRDYEQMDRWIALILEQAHTVLDKVQGYEIKLRALTAQNKLFEGVKVGIEVLALLGIELPEQASEADIGQALGETMALLGETEIEDLLDLPDMVDPQALMAIEICLRLFSLTYVSAPSLYPLLVFRIVNLSVTHGNMPLSARGYVAYGHILCGVVGDIETGYRFGQLALNLVEKLKAKEIKASVVFMVNAFVRHWKEPFRVTLKPLLEAYQIALETGDFEFAGLSVFDYAFQAYWSGVPLGELETEMAKYTDVISQIKQIHVDHLINLYRQAVLNLSGRSEDPCRLTGEAYDEETMLPVRIEAHDSNALSQIYLHKVVLRYLFHQHAQAVEQAALAEPHLNGLVGTPGIPLFHFYDSLARLALFEDTPDAEREALLERVAANQEKMTMWAHHAPMNYAHKLSLVEAERARVLGHDTQARDLYDQAIDGAREHEFVQEEALANELAARFYRAHGQTRIAHHYLRDAHYAYVQWGAKAKVKDLEARYPQFLAQAAPGARPTLFATATTVSGTGQQMSSVLDLTSVLKASQAISGEIVLDKLLTTLMKFIIENAGAQVGYLLLEKKGRWVIEAEGAVDKTDATVMQALPIDTVIDDQMLLPVAVINYVVHTRENVVLHDAAQEGLFTKDPYVVQSQPKSILCAPLIAQGKLTGILYLENNLTTHAFTPERIELLNLLSGQAAISLENARLYMHQVELTNAASRFVPYEFLHFLGKESLVDVQLGDNIQKDMTILVSDIRSFMSLSEQMTPAENFAFINAYLGYVSPVIRDHHGFIDRYTGDSVMALFPKRAEDALTASIETLKQLARYNAERVQRGRVPVRIGIGLHTGTLMLGIVGEQERVQGDIFSDAVNLTNRLEGLTKRYGATIIISGQTLAELGEAAQQYHYRYLGKVQVKGKQESVSIYEVFDGDPAETVAARLETKVAFEAGLSLYHAQQFAEAHERFENVLARNPEDMAARRYLERVSHYLAQGVPAGWDGAEAMTEK